MGEKLDGSFVYVIRGDHRLIKIGTSTNPTARLATLRTASGFPLSFAFIGATNGTSGFAIEQEAHRVLEKHRVEGEWFDIPEELAIATVWAAAASLGEKLAFVDPSRVDEVIKLCAGELSGGDGGTGTAPQTTTTYQGGVGWNGIGGAAQSSREPKPPRSWAETAGKIMAGIALIIIGVLFLAIGIPIIAAMH